MAEKPLIVEIQQDAADESVPVTRLLRKAKMAAVKLDVPDIVEWIDCELNGYTTKIVDDLPNYRQLRGQPKGFNPYYGWRPIEFENTKHYDVFSKAPLGQAIGPLEETLKNSDGDGYFEMPYGPERRQKLMQILEIPTDVKLFLSASQGYDVLHSVRNMVLDWALKLEKKGILGEGHSFSPKEKDEARPASQQIIAENIGYVGSATTGATVTTHQNVNKGIDSQAVGELVEQIRSSLGGLPSDIRSDVEAKVAEIEDEDLLNPENESQIKQLLGSLKETCQSASGNLVAQGIARLIEQVL